MKPKPIDLNSVRKGILASRAKAQELRAAAQLQDDNVIALESILRMQTNRLLNH